MSGEFTIDQKPVSLAAVPGFKAGVAACGLVEHGDDVGVLYCDADRGTGSAVLSRNSVASASVRVSSPRAAAGGIRAIVLNAGSANCCTGEEAYRAARDLIAAAATELDVTQDRILIASTGAIGRTLDIGRALAGLSKACAQAHGKGDGDLSTVLAGAGAERRAVSGKGTVDGTPFVVAGIANGADLAADDAPSRLIILATDAAVQPACLREVIGSVAASTLGRWAIDTGPGTNDLLCVLCSGVAGNEPLEDPLAAESLRRGFEAVARRLVVDLAFAGDKNTRLIEISVAGASTDADAEAVARAIASSVPVRIAIHLSAPRWGLILAAAGKANARVIDSRAVLTISGETVFYHGQGIQDPTGSLAEKLRAPTVRIELDLGIGESSARLWTSDLSEGERGRIQRYDDRLEAESVRRRALEQRIEELDVVAREVEALRTKVALSEKSIADAEKLQAERTELEKKLAAAEVARDAATRESKSLRMQIDIAESKIKKLHAGG